MAAYALRRLLWLAPALLFISLVTFALMHSVQGGPWDDDRRLPPSVTENLDRKYGLDKPLYAQYFDFVTGALHGDLGISYARQDKPVTAIILSGFKVTAVLGVLALAVAVVAGVGLGVLSALNRNRWPDYAGVLFASMGSAVPAFVLGIFLVYIFGVQLHWLPTFGWDTRGGLLPGWLPRWQQLVLPVVTLSALPAAYLARITRASLLEVLRQDYIRTARSKGLGGGSVLFRHAMRNAAIPIVTVLGPVIAGLVTGSFIIEQLFSVPGTGRLFVQSVNARDYGLIMGTTLFYAAVIVVVNLAVDITYAFIDPRIRYR
ncbi:MAG TPA: ABC transporter permease [Dehalococcoidia bacterium]|nr:ABC transporter permease [Dehalococcoidia bacterium]